MATVVISSRIAPTHRPRGELEAWFNDGRPFEAWPDWIRSHYVNRRLAPPENKSGKFALRDDEGYFWRWIDAGSFNRAYEPIPR